MKTILAAICFVFVSANAFAQNVPVRVTYIGTATMVLEIGSKKPFRILTDPALDTAGHTYWFSLLPGFSSKKTAEPQIPKGLLNDIDVALVSHFNHHDNLDPSGRRYLRGLLRDSKGKLIPPPKNIVSTRSAPRELHAKAIGLEPFKSARFKTKEGIEIKITAVPALHNPDKVLDNAVQMLLGGEAVGYVLQWTGQIHGAVYISGDTILSPELAQMATEKKFKIGTAFLHLGGVKFDPTGLEDDCRYTFSGAEAAHFAGMLGAKQIVPIHYDGWLHFREPVAQAKEAFAAAGLERNLVWLQPGVSTKMEF